MAYIGKTPADVLIDPHVESSSITDLTIATADIANDAITNAKIADSQIDSEHYVDGSIDNEHLAGSIAMNKTTLTAGTGITLSTNTLNVDASQTQITSVGNLTGLTVQASDPSVSSYSHTILNVKENDHTAIQISTPNDKIGFLLFGDSNSATSGQVAYNHSTPKLYFATEGTEALSIDGSQNATFAGALIVDDITIDSNTISTSGQSSLTIDSNQRIDLSAEDNGEIRLFDGSSMYAQFKDDDDRLKIQSMIQDKDIMFVGNDGGSEITALTLDMSAGGTATFAGNAHIRGGLLEVGEHGVAGGQIVSDGNLEYYCAYNDASGNNGDHIFKTFSGGTEIARFKYDQSATFAGAMTVGGSMYTQDIRIYYDNQFGGRLQYSDSSNLLSLQANEVGGDDVEIMASDKVFLRTDAGSNTVLTCDGADATFAGRVGIGATPVSSSSKLWVVESESVYALRVQNTRNPSSSAPYCSIFTFTDGNEPNNSTSEFLHCNDSAATRMIIYSNGGIGNYQSNDYNMSDERLKEDIVNAPNALANLNALTIRNFKYIGQEDDTVHTGLIAQEVEEVIPTIVKDAMDDMKGIKSVDLQYMMLKAIQELSAKVTALENA